MGTVPVAPNNKMLVLSGARNVSGFMERLVRVGFRRSEITYMPILI